MCIRLRLGRCIGGHGRAQVAKTRHRDHTDAARGQASCERHTLIKATATAVHGKQRHADAALLILDGAAPGLQQNTTFCRVLASALHLLVEARFHKQSCAH